MPRPDDPETLALLSAFLDGELSAAEEQDLLRQLEQRPELQDALDALAEEMAMTQRAIAAEAEAAFDGDVLGAVLAALPAQDVPASADGGALLASLVADGEANDAQVSRLESVLANDEAATAAVDTLSFIDAARAVAQGPGESRAVAATLERLPVHIIARVERAERGAALAAGAADGALTAAEADELAGLAGVDAITLDVLEAAVAARRPDGVDQAVTEVLAAFTASPAVARLGQRAGAAALQAIEAERLRAADAERVVPVTAAASSGGLWAGLRAIFSQGIVPLGAAGMAAVMFFALGNREPDVAGPDRGTRLAEVKSALLNALEPVALAQNRALDAVDLPVIGDNEADVEAIDATGTTMVFQTPASNITVIWLAELEEGDQPGEQGT